MGQSQRHAGAGTEDGEQLVPERRWVKPWRYRADDGIGGEMGLEHVCEREGEGKRGAQEAREDYMQRNVKHLEV